MSLPIFPHRWKLIARSNSSRYFWIKYICLDCGVLKATIAGDTAIYFHGKALPAGKWNTPCNEFIIRDVLE